MKPNLNKFDYLLILGIVLVLLVGIFCIYYYFNFQNNECFREPLVYGAKQMEDIYGGTFQGSGIIIINNPRTIFPSFTFNSTDLIYKSDNPRTIFPSLTFNSTDFIYNSS